jgi:hypothetical protein
MGIPSMVSRFPVLLWESLIPEDTLVHFSAKVILQFEALMATWPTCGGISVVSLYALSGTLEFSIFHPLQQKKKSTLQQHKNNTLRSQDCPSFQKSLFV